ncbi:MAG: hypothetical protein ILA06_09920 [Bacteroidaceae bacterium]|nr:hypothetical protein [Bacteroidaceae bacterium]
MSPSAAASSGGRGLCLVEPEVDGHGIVVGQDEGIDNGRLAEGILQVDQHSQAAPTLTLNICNRYDFIDLKDNVNFEQRGRGIVVAANAAVAGQGPKFTRTAYPVTARDVGAVQGEFYLYRVSAKTLPPLLQDLFGNAADVPAPRHPFYTQYDTYLMRYADIVQ